MITFLWIFAGMILLGFFFFLAYGANQRKRARMSGASEVQTERDGSGAPKIGRASGVN